MDTENFVKRRLLEYFDWKPQGKQTSSSSPRSQRSVSKDSAISRAVGATQKRALKHLRSLNVLFCLAMVLVWIHGITAGVAVNDPRFMSYLLNTFFIFAICALGFQFERYKRLAAAFLWAAFNAYVMSWMGALTWYRNPSKIERLPDIGHDFLPEWNGNLHLESSILPIIGPRLFGEKGINITSHDSVNIIMGVLMLCTAVFVLSLSNRLVVAKRFFVIHGLLMAMRTCTIICTSLPDASPVCKERTPGETKWENIDFKLVTERWLGMVAPGVTNTTVLTCGDMVFSGHTVVMVLCAMTFHQYYKFVSSAVNPVKFSIWVLCFVGMGSIIATRFHYTLDVLLAFYFTITIWSLYHRLANDIVLGVRFTTIFLIDGVIVYPTLEWLEGDSKRESLYIHVLQNCPSPLAGMKVRRKKVLGELAVYDDNDFASSDELENINEDNNSEKKKQYIKGHTNTNSKSAHRAVNAISALNALDLRHWAANAAVWELEYFLSELKRFQSAYLDENLGRVQAEERSIALIERAADALEEATILEQKYDKLKCEAKVLNSTIDVAIKREAILAEEIGTTATSLLFMAETTESRAGDLMKLSNDVETRRRRNGERIVEDDVESMRRTSESLVTVAVEMKNVGRTLLDAKKFSEEGRGVATMKDSISPFSTRFGLDMDKTYISDRWKRSFSSTENSPVQSRIRRRRAVSLDDDSLRKELANGETSLDGKERKCITDKKCSPIYSSRNHNNNDESESEGEKSVKETEMPPIPISQISMIHSPQILSEQHQRHRSNHLEVSHARLRRRVGILEEENRKLQSYRDKDLHKKTRELLNVEVGLKK
eukprot:g298.t1